MLLLSILCQVSYLYGIMLIKILDVHPVIPLLHWVFLQIIPSNFFENVVVQILQSLMNRSFLVRYLSKV